MAAINPPLTAVCRHSPRREKRAARRHLPPLPAWQENLCERPRFTGRDVDGDYADASIVDGAFTYPVPDAIDDEQAAPLLCAGIIGYRAP